jgi:hypothetical protein
MYHEPNAHGYNVEGVQAAPKLLWPGSNTYLACPMSGKILECLARGFK